MNIPVRYWSWFRDLAGTESELVELADGALLADLLEVVRRRHPRFLEVRQSTLVAVGLDYQPPTFRLAPGDEVSLFPPVQGG